MDHYLERHEDNLFNRLGEHLGTIWTREDVKEQVGSGRKDKIRVPLSLAINPKLMEVVKGIFGDSESSIPTELRNEDIIELGDLPVEDMNNMFRDIDSYIKD